MFPGTSRSETPLARLNSLIQRAFNIGLEACFKWVGPTESGHGAGYSLSMALQSEYRVKVSEKFGINCNWQVQVPFARGGTPKQSRQLYQNAKHLAAEEFLREIEVHGHLLSAEQRSE